LEKLVSKIKYKSVPLEPSEITPEHVYLSRRDFLKAIGIISAGAMVSAACASVPRIPATLTSTPTTPTSTALTLTNTAVTPTNTPAIPTSTPTIQPSATDSITNTPVPDLALTQTSYEDIIAFNNFYEFTTSKEGVAELAKDYKTSPWNIQVSGMVNRPRTYAMEDLLKRFPQEERIYRMRCVEGWSMVIPWLGFRLSDLLKEVEPQSSAKYIRFETLFDPQQMPGLKDNSFPWPYAEGLRLDEAMHDLTIIATGLYGKAILAQNGAPLRLVVPWKYGFKSIKSIVKIELVEEQPATLWSSFAPNEYGFYANVNPEVPHPRWSQAREWRIGEDRPRPTLMFNGYAEEVAHLYQGMDLSIYY
jgi:sulfoxide reductase catalytic subunit YedY